MSAYYIFKVSEYFLVFGEWRGMKNLPSHCCVWENEFFSKGDIDYEYLEVEKN